MHPTELRGGAGIPGLYVHVPFCFHKCHYCDFYSITRQSPQRMVQFVDRVLREAEMWTHLNPRPRTVFFGGGTPTLLAPAAMERLLVGLGRLLDLSAVDEWTIEANPATVDLDYCCMLRGRGVDRLSFGAQSFAPGELAILERHHQPPDVAHSLELARLAGFQRLNLDLIYGIPGQDLPSWSQSLESAIALGTRHLSCYGLTYEPNTPLAVRRRLGTATAVEEELELAMLGHTRRRLAEAGLPAYEISNYAAPGEECRHNLNYWAGGNYIGLGPSAASHVEGRRWRNRPHLGEWEQTIDCGELPATDVEHLSLSRRGGELAMLMLRLERGLVFEEFGARLGLDARHIYGPLLERLRRAGLLRIDERAARLTESALPVADAVAAEFLR